MTRQLHLGDFVPTLLLVAIPIGYFWIALGYDAGPRSMPLGVAAATILVILLETATRLEGSVPRWLRRIFQGSGSKQVAVPGLDGQAGVAHPVARELAAFGWILGFTALVLVFGFYPTIPVYVAAYLTLHAGKRPLAALTTAIALTGFLYVMFELLLGYEVFSGLITGDFL